jgi:IPT/TIG domain
VLKKFNFFYLSIIFFKMKNKLLIPFFACCIVTAAYGQLYPVSLNDRIDQSTLIIEGKVIEKRSYTTDKGDIFTANKIKIMSVLKGIITEKELTVTTYGGESGGFVQTWTHMLTLQLQDYGLFCLTPTHLPTEQGQTAPIFEVYAGIQGFLKFRQNDSKAWTAQDPFNVYRNIDTDLFKCIAQRTGKSAVMMNPSLLQNGIRYHFRDMDFDGVTLRFNIYVNSLIGTKSLYKANIQFEYNDFFGTSIASNPTFLQDAGISLSNVYDLATLNLTTQKAQIELLTVGSINQLTSIGPDEQLMAKGAIPVQNLLSNPSVVYDLPAMQLLSKYYENGLIKNFENVLVEGEWGNGELLSPVIRNFFPKVVGAGIKDTITIVGSDFGTTRGTSRVQFYNAHLGDSLVDWVSAVDSRYIFWSDTLIKVVVPSIAESGTSGTIDENNYAGTGTIRVRTGFFFWQTAESADTLTVKFCVQNGKSGIANRPANTDYWVVLSNINMLGGYSLYYAKNFKALVGATNAFDRALTAWRCTTLVNFTIKDSATITPAAGACRIDMASLPPGTATTLAATQPSANACVATASTTSIIGVYRPRFSISFNQALLWHTALAMPSTLPADTYDLESRAVHEIGHAHLLKHSNNHNDLMYFTDLTPPYRRSIEPFDLAGGIWAIDHSTIPVNVTGNNCKPQMIKINYSDCVIRTETVEINGKTLNILIFPTIFEDKVTIKIDNNTEPLHFRILNTLGQVLQIGTIHSDMEQVTLNPQLPVGIYYVSIGTQQQTLITKKIIKK